MFVVNDMSENNRKWNKSCCALIPYALAVLPVFFTKMSKVVKFGVKMWHIAILRLQIYSRSL
jgi:hypothetical protein